MRYETNGDSLVIENTSNGYLENVRLEGRTLVNLLGDGFKTLDNYTKVSGVYIEDDKSFVRFTVGGNAYKEAYRRLEKTPLKTETDYTLVVDILENTVAGSGDFHVLYPTSNDAQSAFYTTWGISATEATPGIHTKLIRTKSSFEGCILALRTYIRLLEGASGYITFRLMLLEGDHTQNPPEYFEGIKSVGEGVDKISVSSLKSGGNLLHCEDFSIARNGVTFTYDSVNQEFTLNGTCTADNTSIFPHYLATIYNCPLQGAYSGRLILSNPNMANFNVRFYEKTFTRGVILNNNKLTHTGTYKTGDVVSFSIRIESGQTFNNDKFKVCFNKGNTSIPYEPYKEHKKELLYKDVDGVWKKPMLCEWNTIEKHSDGKWYYHKRNEQIVLNGTENWNQLNLTPNVRFWTAPRKAGKPQGALINDFTPYITTTQYLGNNHIGIDANGNIVLGMDLSKATDVTSFKSYLQANPITLVYELAQEEVYECLPISVASYDIETTYKIEGGIITPASSFELDYTLSNAVARVLDIKSYNSAMINNLKIILTDLSSKVE